MKALFLSPHNDDETLFGAFTILREKPHVIVCLKSVKQARMADVDASVRESETAQALWWLGDPTWEQWQFPDVDPDWVALETKLSLYTNDRLYPGYERVFAPAWEDGGHEQHNRIAGIAKNVFPGTYTPYLTYRRGHGRSRSDNPVPFEKGDVKKKLRAMSCYESQFSDALGTMPWFVDEGLREFYA